MGASIVNIHVRTDDHEALARQLGELAVDAGWVLPAKNGWATVVEEQASNQDERRIRELAGTLSKGSDAATIAFLVHDSDFVCYWMFNNGQLVDEFNSCPGYFDDDETGDSASVGGQPAVLLAHCRSGTTVDDIEAVLRAESTFAEEQLEAMADLLGIAAQRATIDFRDMTAGRAKKAKAVPVGGAATKSGPAQSPAILKFPGVVSADDSFPDELDVDDDIDEDADSAFSGNAMAKSLHNLMDMLGQKQPASDPAVAELVEAAAVGDVATIDRLVAAGVNIEGQAPVKSRKEMGSKDELMAGLGLVVAMTPLLAAVGQKQLAATQRLIELGADVNALHPLLGTPVHVATTGGAPEILRTLLDAKADVNQKNAQGHTPLASLSASRLTVRQLAQFQSMGIALPKAQLEQIEKMLPVQGWIDCERLLIENGAR